MSTRTVFGISSDREALMKLTDDELRYGLVLYVQETCRRAFLEDPEPACVTAKAFGDCVGAIGAFHGSFDGMREAFAEWIADDEVWAKLEHLRREHP